MPNDLKKYVQTNKNKGIQFCIESFLAWFAIFGFTVKINQVEKLAKDWPTNWIFDSFIKWKEPLDSCLEESEKKDSDEVTYHLAIDFIRKNCNIKK